VRLLKALLFLPPLFLLGCVLAVVAGVALAVALVVVVLKEAR